MDNHNRSKKHAENVARLLLELSDDDKDDDDGDEKGQFEAADADDLGDDLPELSQSRYAIFKINL